MNLNWIQNKNRFVRLRAWRYARKLRAAQSEGGESDPVDVLHIGKTGGSALRHALVTAGDEQLAHRLRFHTHSVSLRYLPDSRKIVFFLRDPAARFVSAFYGRKRQDRPRYDNPWTIGEARAFSRFATANELATALYSSSRQQRRFAREAMRDISHLNRDYGYWLESSGYLESRRADIFFIGFQESLDEDFRALLRKLGVGAGVSLPEDRVAAHRSSGAEDRRLSTEASAYLQRWYSRDYQLVSHCRSLAEQTNR